jgi:sec-independent protein translocase protein TatA
MDIGIPELLVVLVIVVLIFGVGRVSQVSREFGRAIYEFRKGLNGDEKPPAQKVEESDVPEARESTG